MFKVLCTGSREWTDEQAVARELHFFNPASTVLIHGGCRGLDTIVDVVGKRMGFHVARMDALWNTFGKQAGPRRNHVMIETFQPDHGLVFHADLESSKGTADCVRRLEAKGIFVKKISQ